MINIATKLTFLVAFLICATTVSAQFNYEKKFKDGIFTIRFDRYTGPISLTIKTTDGSKTDTVVYNGSGKSQLFGYEANDTYLSGDTLLLATSNLWIPIGGKVNLYIKKKDGWTWQLFRANLLESTDLEKSHSIQFIDTKRVKTIVDGVEKWYEMDYKEMKINEIKKQE